MAAVTDDIVFFTAQTTDANSTAYRMVFPNKRGQLNVYGTFNGCTVTLQYSPDGGTTYIAAKDVFGANIAFTANGSIPIEAPLGELLRCNLADDGASTSITAVLKVI